MSFENFPYSNFHELNLDWIVQKLKEAYSSENPPDYPVKSVNGQTGDVIIAIPSNFVQSVNGETGDVVLYRNPLTQFPATDEVRWNLFRICDGTETGIEFDENGASRIEGIRRIKIYDEDNPPNYPVTSVNGQTGDVQITAGVQSVNGKTGNVVTPFVNPNTDILTLDSNSPSVLWGISRNVPGGNVALYITTGGTNPQAFIRYIPDGGQAINLPLLTTADIPSSAGVVSVNGKNGAVTLYGSDILTTENGNTISQDINDLKNATNPNIANEQTWIRDVFYSHNGTPQYYPGGENTKFYSTFDYVIDNCTYITTTSPETYFFRVYVWNSENTYQGIIQNDNTIVNNNSNSKYYSVINVDELRTLFPGMKFKVTLSTRPEIVLPENIQDYIIMRGEGYNGIIEAIETLQSADATHNQQISALQTTDATHNQQISALQTADATHNQQISALQTADATHNQQISALQSADSTHDQQIAELYTRIGTGIKEATISEVVTLPARYPATGLDNDIKATNKCMIMELSRPGVQHSDWTIETFDGYLTITGTIHGLTDIKLYLI